MSEMLEAVRKGDLFLNHQPKLDLRTSVITGVEALARWNHPTRGFIRPDLFVGMAEETGHIRALTDYVLAQAIEDQARLRAAGHDVLMSVNISGRLIDDVKQGEADGVAAIVIAGDPSVNAGMNFCGQPGSCGCNGIDCGVFHADRLYEFIATLGTNGYAADLCAGAQAVPTAVETALTASIDLACEQFEPPM